MAASFFSSTSSKVEPVHLNAPILRSCFKRLVGVHQGEPDCVRQEFLRQRQCQRVAAHEAQLPRALEKMQQHERNALARAALADGDEILAENAFLSRRQPRHVEGEARVLLVQGPELLAREHAQDDVGQRLERMTDGVEDRGLQADEIARQGKVQHLAAPVLQGLVLEGPARQDRVEVGAVGAFAEDRAAGLEHQFSALEAADESELFCGELPEDIELAQRTLGAGRHRRRLTACFLSCFRHGAVC